VIPRHPRTEPLAVPGCFRLQPFRQDDGRGWFLKPFHEPSFRALGLETGWKETFVSLSAKGVLRGMHFQSPPHHQAKLVTCLSGRVLDVVLDLRANSPAFGRCAAVELDGGRGEAIYLPSGCAHGFLALEDGSMLQYQVTTPHAPSHDHGILWSSIPFHWPVADPVLADRDRAFPPLAGFATPFQD
jgi:dTDP-4-dehydrorhamnose 3,5-epimerase